MEASHLIENTTKNYIFSILQQCHKTRTSFYYYVLNSLVLISFLGITGYILYQCNKSKLSDEEKKAKLWKDQQYVLSKIRYFKEENQKHSQITNLPFMKVQPG